MAEIKKDEIIEKGFLDKAIKDAKKLKSAIDDLNQSFEESLKVQQEFLKQSKKPVSTKDIKEQMRILQEVDETVTSLNKTRKASITIDKEIAKSKEKVTKIEKDNLRLRKQLKEANSDSIQDNEEIKLQLQEQRKVNKELAKDKLGLISVYEKESKKLKELKDKYKSLRLETGKETKDTKKLRKEIKILSSDLEDVSKEAGQFGTTLSKNVDDLKSTTKGMIAAGAAAVGLKLSFDGLASGAQGSAAGSENLRKVTGALTGGIIQGSNVVASTIVDLFNFTKAVASGEKELKDITDAFEETGKATENFGDKVAESASQGIDIAQSLIDFEKAARPLEQRMSSLNKIIEEQSLIAGDGTRSFNEIREAALRSQEAQSERANIVIKLAKEELRILNLQVDQANKAGGASVDLLDQQTEAIVKLQEARNAASLEELQTEQILRQEKQDRLERDLDILIDGFDNQKTINERLIADERKTFEERKRIFQETTQLANESFLAQKEVLSELSSAGIDVDELLGLDATELNKRIRELEQSEIIEGRTLEVVRERRIVLQDLADIERDLDDVLKERIETQQQLSQEIDNEIRKGEIAAAKREQDTETEFRLRRQTLKDQAFFETNLVATTADEKTLIAEKLKNDLAALDAEEAKSVENKNAKILESERQLQKERESIQDARFESSKNTVELLSKLSEEDSKSQEALIAAKKIIAGTEIFVNLNREVAAIRAEVTDNEALKRAKIFEARTSAALSVAGVLSAYEGMDDTGTVKNPLDAHGGRLMNIHDNEQIWSKQNVKDGGGRTRQEAIDILQAHDKGLLVSPHAFKSVEVGNIVSPNDINYAAIIKNNNENTDKLAQAFKKGQAKYDVHWNTRGEAVERLSQNGSSRIRTFRRS